MNRESTGRYAEKDWMPSGNCYDYGQALCTEHI